MLSPCTLEVGTAGSMSYQGPCFCFDSLCGRERQSGSHKLMFSVSTYSEVVVC